MITKNNGYIPKCNIKVIETMSPFAFFIFLSSMYKNWNEKRPP
jgi:hypothetical protein